MDIQDFCLKKSLMQKIQGMLYERTIASKKSEKLIQQELATLLEEDHMILILCSMIPIFLDFFFKLITDKKGTCLMFWNGYG
jgi:predicted nuclease of restriction endonuclease-like (RecB) superfamily